MTESSDQQWVTALVANPDGEIFELEGFAATGMAGGRYFPLSADQMTPLPHGSELMYLPDRIPVLYNRESRAIAEVDQDPYEPGVPLYPVAAFNSPGYVITASSAYIEQAGADYLPLFSYGAVGWGKAGFCSAVIQVDAEPRQDLRQMPHEEIVAGVEQMRAIMPDNRLRAHLEKCALEYGCPAGKNFFLGRYEAPLPTATTCNARCLGCLSLQTGSPIHCSQDRIAFTPSPAEIAEIALEHIRRVDQAVVSFGQGCEGDPLMAADAIEAGIRLIREKTDKGTINLNTNASRPETVARLFDAGLDAMRISINSLREKCYTAYFRPRNYCFSEVMRSAEIGLEKGKFVSLNYLNVPGFTDTPSESQALIEFLRNRPIQMIQWRNLNFDPLRYWEIMNAVEPLGEPMGMETLLARIRHRFPRLIFGYFNPPRERFHRT